MKSISLAGSSWTVESLEHAPVPAQVPGCVHDALLNAGLIPDPDAIGGESAQAFVGHADWVWCTEFEVESELFECERLELCLDSVDTTGTVELNGQVLAQLNSQFTPHRLEVRQALRPGANHLVVRLRGTLDEAKRLETIHGTRPVNADGAWGPFSQMRKSACNFGWDWGPCCPTCGLAGDVRLECFSGTRIAGIRLHCHRADPNEAEVSIDVDLDGDSVEHSIQLIDDSGRELTAVDGPSQGRLQIRNPPLWWPRDLGDPKLITVRVRLANGATAEVRTGLRTSRLIHDSDGRFVLEINGEPVFCRGANWIPARLFPHGQSIEDVAPLLSDACEANMNMIRVWGGGLYEPDWFYERCDELGLMVWQDFMFACATYPEHESFKMLVEQEARAQVARLAHHPSIMLWCGGNEDLLAWYSWGWRERMDPKLSVGIDYWTRLLPEICCELDATRPYWVESPFSGSLEQHPNDPDTGDRHVWDLKFEQLRTQVPRFASEFGHQSPPCAATIEQAFDQSIDSLQPADLADRQRAWGGDEVQYEPFLEDWFGLRTDAIDLPGWIWACQLLQARAMRTACSWYRANQPRCEGALIWQLNDVWTGHSWSLVDVERRRKPAFHAVREAFNPLGMYLEPLGESLCFVLINGSNREHAGTVHLERVTFSGKVLASRQEQFSIPPRRGRLHIDLPASIAIPEDPSAELIVAHLGDRAVHHFFQKDRTLALPEPEFELEVKGEGRHRTAIELTARSLLSDACILIDGLPSVVNESFGLFTLLPGQRQSIEVTGQWLGDARVRVRTANELVQ